MLLIIGNVIALIASILMVYSGVLKEKKKVLYIQSIQIILYAIGSLVLNGITGFIVNIINFIRNILCYKDKLGLIEKIILSVLALVLTILFNNKGIIGYLPFISASVYLWLMTTKDIVKFKLLIIFTLVLWIIYDLTIQSYTATVFDILTIITNIVGIIKLKKK